jgi:hypothetical protein
MKSSLNSITDKPCRLWPRELHYHSPKILPDCYKQYHQITDNHQKKLYH